MNHRPHAVFFGTSEFAVPILDSLDEIAEIAGVVTQPDRPAGRGQPLQPSAVKRRAGQLNLPVLAPDRLDTVVTNQLQHWRPTVVVLAAYGKILPPAVLNLPPKGFINIHPSLLPKYRGPSPAAAAILADDQATGVTLIVLDDEIDHGPIVAQQSLDIKPGEHRSSLESRLSNLGANMLRQSLTPYLQGSLPSRPQDHAQATYCRLLKKSDALLDWMLPANELERHVRAFDPWPGTNTTFNGKLLKVLAAEASDGQSAKRPGTVVTSHGTPAVVCGQGILMVRSLQLAGGKTTEAAAFARGYRDFVGSVLGS